jgi:hypothetical protein
LLTGILLKIKFWISELCAVTSSENCKDPMNRSADKDINLRMIFPIDDEINRDICRTFKNTKVSILKREAKSGYFPLSCPA